MLLERTCRVCGKKYKACITPNPNSVFRWRDVACSIACAQQYLDDINSKNEQPDDGTVVDGNCSDDCE